MPLLGSSRPRPTARRSPRALAALASVAALSLSFGACNAIFDIEPGQPQPTGSGGIGGGGGSGGTGGSGGSGGSVEQCGTGGSGLHEGSLRWAQKPTESTYALGTAVAFGASNDVIVAGMFSVGDIQFNEWTLVHQGNPDTHDSFLVSFDQVTEEARWAVGITADEQQIIYDIDVHPGSGDIALTGYIEGTAAIGGGPPLTSQGVADVVVARLDKDGNHLWSKRYGDAETQIGINVAFDGAGNVILGALIFGIIQFGDDTWGTPDNIGLFLAKFDPAGAELWSRFYQTGFYEGEYLGLDADADGNIVVTGSGSGPQFQSDDPFNGQTDIYVMKFDTDGTYLWSRMFGGTTVPDTENGRQWGAAAVFDCTGDVFITGAFQKDLAFSDLPVLTSAGPDNEDDIFVARLRGSDGEPVWARAFGDAGHQRGFSIGTDRLSNVVVSGVLVDTDASTGIDLGSGTKHLPAPPDGPDHREDLFIAKYAPDGGWLWSYRFGDQFIQQGKTAVDPSGAVACAGDFFFNIQFDGTPGGELSDSQRDMFVALFNP